MGPPFLPSSTEQNTLSIPPSPATYKRGGRQWSRPPWPTSPALLSPGVWPSHVDPLPSPGGDRPRAGGGVQ